MKKRIPSKNMIFTDRLTYSYLSMRYLGMLMYVDLTWFVLDSAVLPCKDPSSFMKISSAVFTLASAIGRSNMPLLFTYHL